MGFKAKYISYRQTASFSTIVTDYLDSVPSLDKLFTWSPDINGIKKAVEARKNYSIDRSLLVNELKKQYAAVQSSEKVNANIDLLFHENTFTICTAHQPNIFTGHLYFIYKILHSIRLADELNAEIADCNFIPVYYMGSEDADLEELGEISINGKKYNWQTKQKGAVGRMKIDKPFIALIQEIEGQLSVENFGKEIITLVRDIYTLNKTIEQATFEFVHILFSQYGLLILLPDNPALKKEFISINKKELHEQFSHKLVIETINEFPKEYKTQAAGRNINLFYLKDDIRERIESNANGFVVANTSLVFTKEEIDKELNKHPERFSQNVILRPVFQEMILPNIAFIGGGGELAYWLELKKVFEAVGVPFPVLILRNSFMIINKKISGKIKKIQLCAEDFFKSENILIEQLVKEQSSLPLQLNAEKIALKELYGKIGIAAAAVNATLQQHTEALKTQALQRIQKLEKKMLKAEKRKFEAEQRQIHKIKESLFPSGTLQERVDNLLPYYSVYGKAFIDMIYENSKGLKQEFCIIEESS